MKKLPAISDYFLKHAGNFGAEVTLDDTYGYAGKIVFPNGNTRYFKYNHIDINTVGSSEIAKDKSYAAFFMSGMGYKTIEGQVFFSNEWAVDIGSTQTAKEAVQYASKIGFPVFVKPNDSGTGFGVSIAYNTEEMNDAIENALLYSKVFLVQKPYLGRNDYRLVVFNGEFICAYKKEPLFVMGDGTKTMQELFDEKKKTFDALGRSFSITLDDYRIKNFFKREGMSGQTILDTGVKCVLLPNANLSQGGEGVDVTDEVTDSWKIWAIELAKKMNLKFCGIDVLVSGDVSGDSNDSVIIEVNASPGLNHYKTLGKKAMDRTDDLYKKILDYLAHS